MSKASLHLVSANGRVAQSWKLRPGGAQSIDLASENLASGVYVVSLRSEGVPIEQTRLLIPR